MVDRPLNRAYRVRYDQAVTNECIDKRKKKKKVSIVYRVRYEQTVTRVYIPPVKKPPRLCTGYAMNRQSRVNAY